MLTLRTITNKCVTTFPYSMVTLTEHESELIDQLLAVLEESIEELPSVDLEFANKVKVQKLLFVAIDEYDIPVTYSWYLAGAVVPNRDIGPQSLQSPQSEPSGPTGPSLPSQSVDGSSVDSADSNGRKEIDPILFNQTDSQQSETPPRDLTEYVSHDELYRFFRQKVPEVWQDKTMRFLQNFYQAKAPEQYRLLYIESTHIRTHLQELHDVLGQYVDGETPDTDIGAIRDSIELSISDLHYYLRQNEGLKETFEIVVEGTDLIEDAIMCLDNMEPSAYTQKHVTAVESLKEFFFYYIWKYPCLLISQITATGPQAEALRQRRRQTYETFDENVLEERSKLSDELSSLNLVPSYDDYQDIDNKQLAETLNDLSTEYLE